MASSSYDDECSTKVDNMNSNPYANYIEEDSKKLLIRNLRTFAFISIVISTVAVFICVVSLPMIYNYAQHIHAKLQEEMDYCKVFSVQFLALE